jgi:hypothetical protein
MKITALVFAVGFGLWGCSTSSSSTGAEMCVAAGGQCLLGGHSCPVVGAQDCNPDRNPGGAFCCLPCPAGTRANDAGTACE